MSNDSYYIICGPSRANSMLVIPQEVVSVEAFNNLVDYRFEEFANDTKEANGLIL